ncbi:MAG TPA: tetratricopeptide repeat protein [Actinophytocola sp.]|uniref:ATP-binding protein n=1 Tax=Actinophytocola sp. TaxID=1872138 RepID=UPI002DBE744A|nr:tetratricopeptide repeat protein [Actinophytocola sp.]HEU5474723.1 tetratricopeptide repeat protein [Actinophytocola sp.]
MGDLAVHRTILAVDIERFGDLARSNRDRVRMREVLYRTLSESFDGVGIGWSSCEHEDRGDGVLVVIPATVAKGMLVESLPELLESGLLAHNHSAGPAQRIRLRMALHAGEVHYDDHGVVGTAVNHTFRLLDAPPVKSALAASDGVLAVITSSWFYEEVVRHCTVHDAYASIPVSVKETNTTAWVRLPGGVSRAGPRDPVPRQLPVRHRHFAGRRGELDQLATVLDAAAAESGTVIITAIAGTAGIGKTALAMHWAHQILDRFPDGQLHVNLRGFDAHARLDPSQVLHGFLEALGVVPSGIPSDLDARAALYRGLVADRRLLIMLDNAASADQVRPLLPNTPTCLVIVTSRNRLDGLAVREGAHRIALDVLPDSDARDLLAARITPDRLAGEPEAAADLINLCARLPLALSIVAARAANHPLASLVRELDDERNRLDALDLGDPDLDLRAVFSWSYRALSPESARLFRLLGLHPGPDIDRHACAALLDRPPLTELTAANLLDEYRPNRFRFHDLLRTYAAECAERDESPSERRGAMQRMIDYYLAAAALADFRIMPCRDGVVRTEPATAGLPVIATVRAAMDWFTAQNETLLAMITLAARQGFDARVDQLAWACDTFLGRTGQRHERVAVNRMALDAARRCGDLAAQIRNLWSLSRTVARMGHHDEAARCLAEASDVNHILGDEYHQIAIHLAHVQLLDIQQRHAEAMHHARRALDLARHSTSRMYLADALTAASWDQARLGSSVEALPFCEQALEIYSEIGHPEGNAYAFHVLGNIHQELGDHTRAIQCYRRSIEINRELGSRYWEAVVLDRLGDAHHAAGLGHRAQLAWRQASDILDTLRHPDAEVLRKKCAASRRHRDESEPVEAIHNDVAGSIGGHVVQTGSITGDVHLHAAMAAGLVPRQLPASPRCFAGRAEELAAMSAALGRAATGGGTVVISAIEGLGGIGKTWLALYWAHQHLERFPDGQLFINLRGFDPVTQPVCPEAAVRTFLHALEIDASRIPNDPEAQTALYRSLVAGRRMLIVLDNAATVEQVLPLLPGSSSCTVIVTSRHRLASLVTAHEARTLPLDVLTDGEAEELLAERIGTARMAAEPQAVSDLLAYCAGLPLALSIVAARVNAQPRVPLSTLVAELTNTTARLAALDGGDDRSNLATVFSWSCRTLSGDAATLFRLLGLAPGPDISRTAAASLLGRPTDQVGVVLRQLDGISLVHQHSPGRWRTHDLVKHYAAARARHDLPPAVRAAALRRLVDFYVQTAYAADRRLAPDRRPLHPQPPLSDHVRVPTTDAAALTWFETEHQCLIATQQLAMDHGWYEPAWTLAWALTDYLRWQGHLHDYVRTWQTGLDAAQRWDDPAARAWAHRQLGQAFARLDRHAEASDQLQQALLLAEQAGDVLCQAATRRTISRHRTRQGDHQQALTFAIDALDLYLTLRTPAWEAIARTTVSWCHARVGNFEDARSHCEIALALHQESRNTYGEADSLSCLGYITHNVGGYVQAADHHTRAVALFQNLRNTYKEADALSLLGEACARTNPELAHASWRKALHLYQAQHRTADAIRVQQHLTDLTTGGAP